MQTAECVPAPKVDAALPASWCWLSSKDSSFYFKLAIYRERLNFRDEMMNFEVSDWCGFKAVVKTSAGGFLLFNCQIQQVHTQK